MKHSATLFLFMFDKSFRWLIIFFFCLVLIGVSINSCSIEQNDKMACRKVRERAAYELNVPYSAENKFTYSEISYFKKSHTYYIRGCVETKYANNKVETRHFTAFVKAYNNEPSGFKIENFKFDKKID